MSTSFGSASPARSRRSSARQRATSCSTSSAASPPSRRRSSPSTAERPARRPEMATSLRLRRTRTADARGVVHYARSVIGKTLRDSRRTTIIVSVLLFLLLLSVTAAVANEFDPPAKRKGLADLVAGLPPILQGLAGKPVNVETMGGYVQYKYGTFFPIVLSLWSILALSSTLASEAKRGSLGFIAAAPISRRRIVLEKLS